MFTGLSRVCTSYLLILRHHYALVYKKKLIRFNTSYVSVNQQVLLTSVVRWTFICFLEEKKSARPRTMYIPRRFIVTAYTFLGFMVMLYLRANLSIALVDMTSTRNVTNGNSTHLKVSDKILLCTMSIIHLTLTRTFRQPSSRGASSNRESSWARSITDTFSPPSEVF